MKCLRINIQNVSLSRNSAEVTLSKGSHTHAVPLKLFALNRSRLVDALKNTKKIQDNALVLLQGGSSCPLYDTDVEYDVFRQVSLVFL